MSDSPKSPARAVLTRRSFLAASGALAGTVALAGCAPKRDDLAVTRQDDAPSDLVEQADILGNCSGACFGACRMRITVRDGKLVQTQKHAFPSMEKGIDYGSICLKGMSHPQAIYSPNRVQYPLRRVEGTERGAEQWERISWEEALAEIAEKWQGIIDRHGAKSIATYTMAGNLELIGRNIYTILFTGMGFSSINGALDNAQLMWSSRVLGDNDTCAGNEIADIQNAKVILCWGSNPAESCLPEWKFIAQARRNGAKFVVIDPNYTATAEKADLFVPVRIGSDAALALGMCNVVLENGWQDELFLRHSTVAPCLVKESDKLFLRASDLGLSEAGSEEDYLVGWDAAAGTHARLSDIAEPALEGSFEVEGHKVTTAYSLLVDVVAEYPASRAAEICDVPEDTIRELADLYCNQGPSFIWPRFGLDHYTNGHLGYWSMMTLASLCGQIGKNGASAGFMSFNGAFLVNQAADATAGVAKDATGVEVAIMRLPETVRTKRYKDQDVDLKSLVIFRGNMVQSACDRTAILDAMKQMEFIVAIDREMTDSSRYADIVLPAPSFFEADNMHLWYIPYISYAEPAIEPLYESKPDFEIAKLIAAAMGREDLIPYDTVEEYARYILDTDACRDLGITYESLKGNIMRTVKNNADGFYVNGTYGEADFGTATGRVQFYLENTAPLNDWGQEYDHDAEHLPRFEPPTEAWEGNELSETYPFIGNNLHSRWRAHSQFGYTPWLRELDAEPVVFMNDGDAGALGIADDDMVRVFNDRGEVVLKAQLSAGMRPGCITIPKGWQEGQYESGHISDLLGGFTSPICINQCYNDWRCDIEKVEA